MRPQTLDLCDRLPALAQYLLPKKLLTAWAGSVATSRAKWTRVLIRWFISRDGVGMAEAAEPDASRYACFNDFFTRALRDGIRPLATVPFVSPVDGTIIQCGRIEADQVLQAKGHRYSAHALVAGDSALAATFNDGDAVTLYLSPRDYHRVHMPCEGRLLRMVYVPGSLFSVNPATVRGVPGLFSRNERVVCLFDSAAGPFVMVLVGAMIVGGIMTAWHSAVNASRPAQPREWRYADQAVELSRGMAMGRFLVGSTVIMLFPKDTVALRASWLPGRLVRVGEAMADLRR